MERAGGGGGGSIESLAGSAWDLTAMTPAVPGSADVTISARFEGGRLSGHSGCNTYHVSYTQDGSKLTIGEDIVTTRIVCPSGPSRVERSYLERLPRLASFTTSGSTLTLRAADGTTLLQYRSAPSGARHSPARGR